MILMLGDFDARWCWCWMGTMASSGIDLNGPFACHQVDAIFIFFSWGWMMLMVDDVDAGWWQCHQLDEVQITSSMMPGDVDVSCWHCHHMALSSPSIKRIKWRLHQLDDIQKGLLRLMLGVDIVIMWHHHHLASWRRWRSHQLDDM
jgi:hypothetical protein